MNQFEFKQGALRLGLITTAVALAACSTLQSNSTTTLKAATGANLPNCSALASQLNLANTRIESSALVSAGTIKLGDNAVPEHCLVKGRMHERKGSDGRDYAIGFEMRLPIAWNGRFFYQGNGGLDGAVVPALGALGRCRQSHSGLGRTLWPIWPDLEPWARFACRPICGGAGSLGI